MGKFSWDHGLDFDETRPRLASLLLAENPRKAAYLAVLLTQLTNGARVSEALDAVKAFVRTGSREQEVRVRKIGSQLKCSVCGATYSKRVKKEDAGMKKHQRDTGHVGYMEVPSEETRLIVIPQETTEQVRKQLKGPFAKGVTVGDVKVYALTKLGFNTHSLRYAQITKLASQGVAPQVIAKVSHHKTLSFILSYTQQKEADRVLRQLVSEEGPKNGHS